MGAFRVLLGSLHYLGLYMQLSVSSRQAGHHDMENQVSGNAVFTEVPHDVSAHRGQDVEMACSFRGAGTPSYSLEIQWWYIRNHLDWTDRQPWITNEVAPEEEMPKDATKISVVKVVGSNISHKLRLSRVKPSDEGTYECRVIDFSDDAGARHHRARAYLQVVADGDVADNHNNFEAVDDTKRAAGILESKEHNHHQSHGRHQEHDKRPPSASHHNHGGGQLQHKASRELRKREVDSNHSHNDCTDEPSCAL
ncbi:V-set and transmembrane domain-containing protein 2-like protein [Oryzias melastigma]|uniref:V-set and transmembrane domain-containing protein 2-like protein n=1 Tax=Oryzias melastigma TaxID=30732 RepID=A0A3B3DKI7_ORYME|nr:V-set and transmembrane domain-containing protein 2-like protein [Oryzias melastigma]KAF6728043.1 V-set and transmembrane domain-containing protein 2-like protein [Oryzias melastigma]